MPGARVAGAPGSWPPAAARYVFSARYGKATPKLREGGSKSSLSVRSRFLPSRGARRPIRPRPALAIAAGLRRIRARNPRSLRHDFELSPVGPLHVGRRQLTPRISDTGPTVAPTRRTMARSPSLALDAVRGTRAPARAVSDAHCPRRFPIARLPIAHCPLPISDPTLSIADYRSPITDRPLPIAHYRLPDSQLQIVDRPLSIAYRLPIVDCQSALPIADVFAIADSPIADRR